LEMPEEYQGMMQGVIETVVGMAMTPILLHDLTMDLLKSEEILNRYRIEHGPACKCRPCRMFDARRKESNVNS